MTGDYVLKVTQRDHPKVYYIFSAKGHFKIIDGRENIVYLKDIVGDQATELRYKLERTQDAVRAGYLLTDAVSKIHSEQFMHNFRVEILE